MQTKPSATAIKRILDATERSRANNWERLSFAGMATP
jgi:hypothetical protein